MNRVVRVISDIIIVSIIEVWLFWVNLNIRVM